MFFAGSYNVDVSSITVSGLSAGGAMAMQFHVNLKHFLKNRSFYNFLAKFLCRWHFQTKLKEQEFMQAVCKPVFTPLLIVF